MDFHTLLARHAAAAPDRIAFRDGSRELSYGGLLAEADRLAALMQARGARRGERLALWMPNCAEWLVTFLAAARLGMTVIAVNTRFREHEVGQLVRRGKCTWLALWPDFKGLPFIDILKRVDADVVGQLQQVLVVGGDAGMAMLRREWPALGLTPFDGEPEAREAIRDPGRAEDGALVYTTSGTTSAPKLVLHRQAGLLNHGAVAAATYGVSARSAVLIAAPLCGAFGFSTLLSGLAAGASLVTLPVFDAAVTVRQIRDHGVTHTFANNELINLLLRETEGEERPFPSLEYVGYASFAPSMDDLPERALRAGMPIAGLYGSSELQALVAGQRQDTEWEYRRMAGGHLASPAGRVRAVDPETGDTLPHGAIGQIEILAPSLMSEYLDDPEATRKAVSAEGFFRTGDMGFTLSEQAFIFQGRDGEHLRLGGFLVNPMEIESFIRSLDGVEAVQVVGAEQAGKTVPVAFVIASPQASLSEADVIVACQATMAKFKAPARVVFVPAFPMVQSANSNKVKKHELRQAAQALFEAG